MKRSVAVSMVCLAVLMSTAVAAEADSVPVASGGASGIQSAGSFTGDRITVQVTGIDSGDGRFHLVHRDADGSLVMKLWGVVDCATSVGDTANITGTITAIAPGLFDARGEILAITIVDGEIDWFGVEVSFAPTPHAIAPCQATAATVQVDRGNLIVR